MLAFKRMLSAVLVVCLFSTVASAQSDGNVIINSDPQGSLVNLEGELSLSAVTPVKFDRKLSGRYEIEIKREGFENYLSTAYFTEMQMSQLDIKLIRKTRTKSFFRSMIIPGWGQRYYGNSTKSTLFALGSAAGAITYLFIKDDYDNKMDTYEQRLVEREAAIKWNEIPALDAALRDAQQKASDAEDNVNIIKVVVIGVYVWNVLDAVFFFPDYTAYTEYKAITARPLLNSDRIGLAFSMRF